jgi:hypothetical protein
MCLKATSHFVSCLLQTLVQNLSRHVSEEQDCAQVSLVAAPLSGLAPSVLQPSPVLVIMY